MKKLLTISILTGGLAFGLADAAQMKTISFNSQNQSLAGHLYLPDDYQSGDRLPGVVVTGSWTSVKEQMSGGYAEELADRGFAALAFDPRGWGESNIGTPESLKFVEDPQAKTQDILAAVNFLATRPEVDDSKLATLGICASAGYAIDAANSSDKISVTASVAPWLHDPEIVQQVYGDSIPALLEAAKETTILSAAGSPDSGAVMAGAEYYIDPKRGAIAAYDNKFSTLSWKPWLTYDAIQTATVIDKPVLLVHSQAAAIPQGAEKFASQGGDNVTLIMLDDVSQFDFYDAPHAMHKASDEVAQYFNAFFD